MSQFSIVQTQLEWGDSKYNVNLVMSYSVWGGGIPGTGGEGGLVGPPAASGSHPLASCVVGNHKLKINLIKSHPESN